MKRQNESSVPLFGVRYPHGTSLSQVRLIYNLLCVCSILRRAHRISIECSYRWLNSAFVDSEFNLGSPKAGHFCIAYVIGVNVIWLAIRSDEVVRPLDCVDAGADVGQQNFEPFFVQLRHECFELFIDCRSITCDVWVARRKQRGDDESRVD